MNLLLVSAWDFRALYIPPFCTSEQNLAFRRQDVGGSKSSSADDFTK